MSKLKPIRSDDPRILAWLEKIGVDLSRTKRVTIDFSAGRPVVIRIEIYASVEMLSGEAADLLASARHDVIQNRPAEKVSDE